MRDFRLSQHFLKSPRLALYLIGHSNLKKHDTVLEIGAGSGVITSALSRRVAKVIAIEPDPCAVAKLRANLAKYQIENVEIIEQNFETVKLPEDPYKVFANPPFHLSSKILHKLIESMNPPTAIYLILQKQFALKLLNNTRHYTSKLGYQLTTDYATRIRLPLKPTDFTPPPAVPCVLFEAKQKAPNPTDANAEESSEKPADAPELPEGEAPALDGELPPEPPEGFDGELPELPDGEYPEELSDGELPELPDGERPAPRGEEEPPKRPEDMTDEEREALHAENEA